MPSLPRTRRPGLEALEDRAVPAAFGRPWADPGHLTVSFAPDTTALAGRPSDLYASLDAELPRATWQRAMLQALQTWASAADVDFGLVADGGIAFGSAGGTQGDARFGDVRVGGRAMSADVLAAAVPNDPLLSGTWTGDVFVNTQTTYTGSALFAAMLHEAGHVLGLPESSDPASVMYPRLGGPKPFTAADLAAVRSLYGAKSADPWEGKSGNGTFATAARIKTTDVSDPYDGRAPLVTFGKITSRADTDVYRFTGLAGHTGPVTIQLRTAGLSLLGARLTIYDALGRVVLTGATTSHLGGVVSLRLPVTTAATTYFARVESATADVFAVGRYALTLSFDRRVTTTPAQLVDFLRRAPSTLFNVDKSVVATPDALLSRDAGTDDTADLAPRLRPSDPAGAHNEAVGSLETAADVDWYRVRSPRVDGATFSLTVSLNRATFNGVDPVVSLFDDNLAPLAAEVFVNGNGTYTVQATGIADHTDVYLRIASPDGRTGNYLLRADYGSNTLDDAGFAISSLTAAAPAKEYRAYLGYGQLMQFTLSAVSADPAAAARFDLRNAAGVVVRSLSVRAGAAVTAEALFLPAGAYSATVTLTAGTGIDFRVRGVGLSNPIGPAMSNPLLAPQYVSPTDPTQFLYPGDWSSRDPYFWAVLDPGGYLLLPSGNGAVVKALPLLGGLPVP